MHDEVYSLKRDEANNNQLPDMYSIGILNEMRGERKTWN